MSRVRISPAQLKMIAMAAASPWGIGKEEIYRDLHGYKVRHWRQRDGDRLPDTLKASVHRSLSRLTAGGFLQYEPHRSHDGKTWQITPAGEEYAKGKGLPVMTAEERAKVIAEARQRLRRHKERVTTP